MSGIAELYNSVMNDVNTKSADDTEKVAADLQQDDEGFELNAEFFEKVASGDEEAVNAINSFIEEARAEGATEEQIENAINEAMEEAGVEGSGASDEGEGEGEGEENSEDLYEAEKAAAYLQGAEEAFSDVLNGELAKEAGVTMDDLIDYELGGCYGAGYAETRAGLEEVVEKIAARKTELAEVEKNASVKDKVLGALKRAATGAGAREGLQSMAKGKKLKAAGEAAARMGKQSPKRGKQFGELAGKRLAEGAAASKSGKKQLAKGVAATGALYGVPAAGAMYGAYRAGKSSKD